MRLLKTCLYRVCELLCLFSAAYMTYMQFQHYLKNEDFASISYRKFNKEEKDEYPSFTVCLVGLRGQIFTQFHDVINTANYTRESYSNYLNGFLLRDFQNQRLSAISNGFHFPYTLQISLQKMSKDLSLFFLFDLKLIFSRH